jgi:hypothetical protein
MLVTGFFEHSYKYTSDIVKSLISSHLSIEYPFSSSYMKILIFYIISNPKLAVYFAPLLLIL